MEIGAHIIVITMKMLVFDVLVKYIISPDNGGNEYVWIRAFGNIVIKCNRFLPPFVQSCKYVRIVSDLVLIIYIYIYTDIMTINNFSFL